MRSDDVCCVTSCVRFWISAAKWMAAQSMDNQIVIYSCKERFRLNSKKRFAGHTNAGYACQVNFSPDGRYVLSGDGDGKLFIWDWKARCEGQHAVCKRPCSPLAAVSASARCSVRKCERVSLSLWVAWRSRRRSTGRSRRTKRCASGWSGTRWRAARWRRARGTAPSSTGTERWAGLLRLLRWQSATDLAAPCKEAADLLLRWCRS